MTLDIAPTADTVVELLRQQASRCREKVAFSYSYYGDGRDGSRVSFRELDSRARAIGAALQRRGAAGARVLVVCRPGLDAVAGVFGCWYAGAVAVPVSGRVGPRLAALIADVGARFAVGPGSLPPSVVSAVQMLVARAGGEPLVWCDAGDGDSQEWVAPGVDADSVALIGYWAGSVRCPRGVVVTHANLMASLAGIGAAWLGDPHALAVSWFPVHQPMGLVGVVLASIYAGGSAVLMAPAACVQRPMCWLEAVSRWRATAMLAPEAAYRWCVQRSSPAQPAGLDFSSVSSAVIGGVGPSLAASMGVFAEAFTAAGFRSEVWRPVYEVAEATWLVAGGGDSSAVRRIDRAGMQSGWALDTGLDDPDGVAVAGCGRPRQPVAIVDPDTRCECGPDEIGEIWVGGAAVAQGYWGVPASDDQSFGADLAADGGGWCVRTGDRGFVRRGELFVLGRCADLVVVKGVNFRAGQVEATVQQRHAALLSGRGAVFTDDGERLVVVQEVSCRVGEPELNKLMPMIQSALLEHHGIQADSILLADEMRLPTTPAGEVNRSACRWHYLDGELDSRATWHAPPASGPPVKARAGSAITG